MIFDGSTYELQKNIITQLRSVNDCRIIYLDIKAIKLYLEMKKIRDKITFLQKKTKQIFHCRKKNHYSDI